MDLVTRSEAFTDKEAAILNYCRMYLNVTTLLDISTARGDQLIPGIEWGELDLMPSRTNGHVNHQQAPAIFFWTYWQRLLRVISNKQGKLFGHLGNWLEPGGRLRRKWNAYFDPKYKFLYRLQKDTYQQYELFDTRFINGCSTPWQPNDYCVPVSIHETSHDCWELTASPALAEHPTHTLVAQTFQEYIQQLPEFEQHLFASLDLLHEPYEILQLFNAATATDSDDDSTTAQKAPNTSPTIHMVSDGSELAQKMTFGWILSTSTGKRLAICSGPAYGTGSSHRAEGTGMLSASQFLFHLEQYCNTPIINQLMYTSDNKGLIIRMRQRQEYKTCYPSVTLAPDWDLTEAIHDSDQHLTKPPKYKHVLGHQDKTRHYTQLPLTAQLNVDADEAAGAFHWSHAATIQTDVALFPTTKAHLRIGDTTITGHYKHHIRRAASKTAMPDYPQMRPEHLQQHTT
jgi:hypothetical protein